MSIEDSINKLQSIKLESEAGSISEQSYGELGSLFDKAVSQREIIPNAAAIRQRISCCVADSGDIRLVTEAFLKIQLHEILENEFPNLDDKDNIHKLLFQVVRGLSSKEEKLEISRILVPIFKGFQVLHQKVFLKVISFIPQQLNTKQLKMLASSVHESDRPDHLTSLHYILTNCPELREGICTNLLAKKNSSQHTLMHLNTSLIPENHPLLEEINKIRRLENTTKVISHFFPKELSENLLNKLKEKEKYISITAIEEEEILTPVSCDFIKEILSDYPELIQDSLYNHWLQEEDEDIELLFEMIVENKDLFHLTKEDRLFKEAKYINLVLYFFPSELHRIILPLVKESLSKKADYDCSRAIKDIFSKYPQFMNSVNEKIKPILNQIKDVPSALDWLRLIIKIGLPEESSSKQEAWCALHFLNAFPKDLQQTVFEAIKPILNETHDFSLVMRKLLNDRPDLKEPLLAEYENRLIPENITEETWLQTLGIAETIIHYGPDFGIDNNHILIRKASNVLTLIIPKNLIPEALTHARALFSQGCPPEELFRAIYTLMNDQQKAIRDNIIRHLSSKNPEIVVRSMSLVLKNANLFEDLAETVLNKRMEMGYDLLDQLNEMDPKEAQKASDFILNNPVFFDYLLQYATEISDLTTEESLLEKNNPYTLFAKLKRNEAGPPIEMAPIYQTIEDKKVSLKPEEVSKFLSLKIDLEKLPSFSYEDFTNMIEEMCQRLNFLAREAIEEVENYVLNITEHSLRTLIDNFYDSGYLKHLLNKKESLYCAYFSAILHFIISQDNSLNEEVPITPREEALLKMSASIQNCYGGKSSGIGIAYTHLPPEYKIPEIEETSDSPEIYEVNRFLKDAIRNKISHFFSEDTPFLRRLLRELPQGEEINQLPHQSIFLKNLIGKAVGLNHTLTFDLHSKVIYPSLIRLTLPEALGAFYEYFTPQVLVTTLVDSFLKIPDEKKGELFHAINSLDLGDMEEIWDASEGLDLTEKGALNLLLKFGLLQE